MICKYIGATSYGHDSVPDMSSSMLMHPHAKRGCTVRLFYLHPISPSPRHLLPSTPTSKQPSHTTTLLTPCNPPSRIPTQHPYHSSRHSQPLPVPPPSPECIKSPRSSISGTWFPFAHHTTHNGRHRHAGIVPIQRVQREAFLCNISLPTISGPRCPERRVHMVGSCSVGRCKPGLS